MFTTVQLILYLHYRHHKVIKATSPYLSLLMFAGCYLLCAAGVFQITYGSFLLPAEIFTALYILHVLCIVNSISLVLVTLFVKLLRIYHIFSAWMNKDLGNLWKTCRLLSIILFFALIPNVLFAILCTLWPPTHKVSLTEVDRGRSIVTEKHITVTTHSTYTFVLLGVTYTVTFLVLLLYIGFNSRNIRQKNFNDSRQIIFLLGVIFLTLCFTVSLFLTFLLLKRENLARFVMSTGLIMFALVCQVVLFSPKLVQVVFEKHSLRTKTTVTTLILINRWTVKLL